MIQVSFVLLVMWSCISSDTLRSLKGSVAIFFLPSLGRIIPSHTLSSFNHIETLPGDLWTLWPGQVPVKHPCTIAPTVWALLTFLSLHVLSFLLCKGFLLSLSFFLDVTWKNSRSSFFLITDTGYNWVPSVNDDTQSTTSVPDLLNKLTNY